MKVIFLDIDGVLNQMGEKPTPIRMVGDILTMADPEMVYRLNLIVDRTDAEIVLSSSWRHMPNWREMMAASGVVKKPLDCTPRHSQLSRGHNIRHWLHTHPEEMRYAILDDDRSEERRVGK